MNLFAKNLSKSFGRTRAVDNVSLTLRPGFVHAIVGENGAGKSTLLRMLAGAIPPDAGEMLLDGKAYSPPDTTAASARGVALVHQEITIDRALTIAENIFIDRLRRFAGPLGFIHYRRMAAAAQAVLDRIGAGISVTSDIDALNLGELKCVEIARALSTNPQFLLLDESTAYLDHREVEAVLGAIRELKAEGVVVAFVSHHLEEVLAVSDELTILKDGQLVGSSLTREIEPDEIHRRMVGRDLSRGIYPPRTGAEARAGETVFEAGSVSVDRELDDVSLAVRAGEILGLAGLKGAGAEALFAAIIGDKPIKTGTMHLAGKSYRPSDPMEAWRHQIAYLPGDRGNEGLIADFSVLDNLVMPRPPRRGPFFDRPRALAMAGELIASIGIKTSSPDTTCRALSGGNLQKVVIGKCLAISPRLLLLNNPTRGVDIGARMEIYRVIRQKASEGLAVILSSEDMPELIGMSDRLLVLKQGRVAHAFERTEGVSEHDIVKHMA
jgi:ABC-type sugar transport system ATPase subunit